MIATACSRCATLESALRQIQAWDMLNPPATWLADARWLRDLVDRALEVDTPCCDPLSSAACECRAAGSTEERARIVAGLRARAERCKPVSWTVHDVLRVAADAIEAGWGEQEQ